MNLAEHIDRNLLVKAFLPNKTYQQFFITKAGLEMPKKAFAEYICEKWNFEIALKIIRDMYLSGEMPKERFSISECEKQMTDIICRWNDEKLGEFKWPCAPKDFDKLVQRTTYKKITLLEKLKEVEIESRRFCLMKMFSTLKHDYVEDLIIKHHKNIVPTLKHCNGYDFFLNGESIDLKVSMSLTNEFKKDKGDNYQVIGRNNPYEVARYLYQYQDESRFGNNPRFLIAFSDTNLDFELTESIIKNADLSSLVPIEYKYHHKSTGEKTYHTKCICIVI